MTRAAAVGLGFLDLIAPCRCPGCDVPVHGELGFCTVCDPLIEPSSDGVAALRYGGPIREAIHRLKYGGRRDAVPALALHLLQHVSANLGPVDCVIPIPLHRIRLRSRGFNQSALLAVPVARALGLPLSLGRLERRRDTLSQVGLDREARARNVEGAFWARPMTSAKRVLLIDDVVTTGATLAAADRALRCAGATEVTCVALAVSDP